MTVSLSNLTLKTAHKTLLREVTLTFPDRGLVALIGPNGCGKTTLLRAVAGLLVPPGGTISITGRYLAELSHTERSHLVAFGPENTTVPFAYSARDIVTMGLYPWHGGRPSAEDLKRVDAVMECLGLVELAQRSISSLSSGERQRVHVARVLASKAALLLCDEPTANLDPAHAKQVLTQLRDTARDRLVIAVIHDINLAMRFAGIQYCLTKESLTLLPSPKAASEACRTALSACFDCDVQMAVTPDRQIHWSMV